MRALFVRAVPAFFVLPLPIRVKPPVCNGMIAPRGFLDDAARVRR